MCRSLAPRLVGARVIEARLLRTEMLERRGARRRRPAERVEPEELSRRLLQGAEVERLERRGKHMAIVARDGRVLTVHLGMSGVMQWTPPTEDLSSALGPMLARHVHAWWRIVPPTGQDEGQDGGGAGDGGGESRLVFADPRRFGGLLFHASLEALHAETWRELGPDGLEIDGEALARALSRSARMIKPALLDQRAVAGVGNIYADEALFEARISPKVRCRRLTGEQWGVLAAAIRRVLWRAVNAGGSTLRDYRDASGVPGRAQELHVVYGRGGKPCVCCGGVLRQGTLGQRTTVWCPNCQGASRRA
jgi:formamidopyrimidine-DNA glycosylase